MPKKFRDYVHGALTGELAESTVEAIRQAHEDAWALADVRAAPASCGGASRRTKREGPRIALPVWSAGVVVTCAAGPPPRRG